MRLIGYYNPSVILTYIGLAASIVGITFALQGNIQVATMLIMVSSVCDMFDGAVARKVKRNEEEKRFGIQIDSLCDLICFGIFPAIIGWGLGIRGWIGIVGMVFFVLCGVIRLAYFNVQEEIRQQQTASRREYYQGLPITTSGSAVLNGHFGCRRQLPDCIYDFPFCCGRYVCYRFPCEETPWHYDGSTSGSGHCHFC